MRLHSFRGYVNMVTWHVAVPSLRKARDQNKTKWPDAPLLPPVSSSSSAILLFLYPPLLSQTLAGNQYRRRTRGRSIISSSGRPQWKPHQLSASIWGELPPCLHTHTHADKQAGLLTFLIIRPINVLLSSSSCSHLFPLISRFASVFTESMAYNSTCMILVWTHRGYLNGCMKLLPNSLLLRFDLNIFTTARRKLFSKSYTSVSTLQRSTLSPFSHPWFVCSGPNQLTSCLVYVFPRIWM